MILAVFGVSFLSLLASFGLVEDVLVLSASDLPSTGFDSRDQRKTVPICHSGLRPNLLVSELIRN
jgi:hypothetical protein